MSVHNGEKTLGAAIHSVLWQTCIDWELLLVNDASTDATARILQQFRDPRIRVVHERQQKGLAVRLNDCVTRARGKYVVRMDADDIAYPERFKRQVEYLDGHPDVDLLGHGAVLFKGDGVAFGVFPTACSHDEICRCPWWGFPLAHPTWMGKRAWFVRHRYTDDLTKGQDQELLLRTYQTSQFAALPDILLGYRMERISMSKSFRGRFSYCLALVSQVHNASSAIAVARGVGLHILGLGRDVLVGLTGNVSRTSRQSIHGADDAIAGQWRAVWDRLKEPMCDS
jgi:glycosyltransferase involved in cell wall biosynthesis